MYLYQQLNQTQKPIDTSTNYLSAPLALRASLGGDPAVSAVHKRLETVDLVLVVDVDFEGEVGPVASLGPWEGTTGGETDVALRCRDEIGGDVRAGGGGAVEEACDEEGGND